jgi:hypothetical protein
MGEFVQVSIPVTPEVARLLQDSGRATWVGKYVSEMLRPGTPATGPLAALIAEVKAAARADGLTDADIDAELEAYNAERRL